MNEMNPIAQWLIKTSETVQRMDIQMRHNGVKKHFVTSAKEALLGTQALIGSLVEVINEIEQETTAIKKAQKVDISD